MVLGGGGKPTVPPAPDLGESQATAIASNLAALPGAEELVSKANAFTQEQITKMLETAIPNYGTLTRTATSNIESMLKGEIPKDVQDAISRSDAAKALGGGYSGTTFHTNLLARDLGLTSLELTQRGLTSAESWIQMMDQLFSPGTINVSSMFITPAMQYTADENAWAAQWMKNQIKAMPDPFGLALGQFVGGVADTAISMAASYFGGPMAGQAVQSAGQGANSGTRAGGFMLNVGGV